MGTPFRDELVLAKNKTIIPFNAYNTDVAVGSASVFCNSFVFSGGTEYRNDRMIQMVQVPVSRELYIQKIQLFSYRVSSGGSAVSPFVDTATNPPDNQNLVDYLTIYLCQNPTYAVAGAGSLADPLRVAISSGIIPSFTVRFNDSFFVPEFDFPFWMSANDTLYAFIDNAFPNPYAIQYNDFKFYTRVTGVLATKSQER